MPELSSYLVIGAVAAGVTFIMTPIVGWLARRRGWVYLPNDRTVHQTPLPDIGGLAMFVGFVAALFTAWLLGAFDVVFDNNSEPLGVLIAAAAIFTVGFIDDIKEISAPAKVIGTVVAGVALVWFGVVMFSFRLPFYDGPIILTGRILHADAEFGGKVLRKDAKVWAMLASANRDPQQFDDAERDRQSRDRCRPRWLGRAQR